MPMTSDQPTQKKPDPCSFVIFGVSGDLTHRLVIPSLYNLAATDLLPDRFCVVGIARKGMSNDALRDSLMKGLHQFATRPVDDAIANACWNVSPALKRIRRIRPRSTSCANALKGWRRTGQPAATGCFTWRRRQTLSR